MVQRGTRFTRLPPGGGWCVRWQSLSVGLGRWTGSCVANGACTACRDLPDRGWCTLSEWTIHIVWVIRITIYYQCPVVVVVVEGGVQVWGVRHLNYFVSHPQILPFPLFFVEQITGTGIVETVGLAPHDPLHNVHDCFLWLHLFGFQDDLIVSSKALLHFLG